MVAPGAVVSYSRWMTASLGSRPAWVRASSIGIPIDVIKMMLRDVSWLVVCRFFRDGAPRNEGVGRVPIWGLKLFGECGRVGKATVGGVGVVDGVGVGVGVEAGVEMGAVRHTGVVVL